jgi:hypothetical protein
LKEIHKSLSLELLRAFFSQGIQTIQPLLLNKAKEDAAPVSMPLSEFKENHPTLSTAALYRIAEFEEEHKGKRAATSSEPSSNKKSKKSDQ